jgi:hypothetical protein
MSRTRCEVIIGKVEARTVERADAYPQLGGDLLPSDAL